jgi:hypothetical protein
VPLRVLIEVEQLLYKKSSGDELGDSEPNPVLDEYIRSTLASWEKGFGVDPLVGGINFSSLNYAFSEALRESRNPSLGIPFHIERINNV